MHHKIILPKHIVIRDTDDDIKIVVALYYVYKKEQEQQRKIKSLFAHQESRRVAFNYASIKGKPPFIFSVNHRLIQFFINIKPYFMHPFTTINKFYDTIFYNKA